LEGRERQRLEKEIWSKILKRRAGGENQIMIEAYIEISEEKTSIYDGVINYTYTCKWVGSKYGVAQIPYYKTEQGKNLKMFPWPLKVVGELQDFGRALPVIRKDVGWHLWWILVTIWYKLFRSRWYYWFKTRVIYTFEVWGLGFQPESEMVSWRNIGRKRGTKRK
jgi:hypothetical protein